MQELGFQGRDMEGSSKWTLLSASGLEGGEWLSVGRDSITSHPFPSAPQILCLDSQQTAASGCESLPEVMVYLGGKMCFDYLHLIG